MSLSKSLKNLVGSCLGTDVRVISAMYGRESTINEINERVQGTPRYVIEGRLLSLCEKGLAVRLGKRYSGGALLSQPPNVYGLTAAGARIGFQLVSTPNANAIIGQLVLNQ